MTRRLMLAALFVFAACGGHPLDGSWNEELAGGKAGMSLTFDTKGTACMVHTAPRADGGHDHIDGTYTFDAATKAVVVKAKLLGAGKSDAWAGTLADDHLELSSPDGKLKFHEGAAAHGH